jgi:hypothetical protein
LLMNIVLSVSIGPTGAVPSANATRRDFVAWAFNEMLISIKPVSEELRQMPLATGAAETAGLPFELPEANLPTDITAQIQYLRDRADESVALRDQISTTLNPSPKQKNILKAIGNIDTAVQQKLGPLIA